MNVITQSVQFTAEDKLLQFIDRKVRRLSKLGSAVLRAEVTLRRERPGQVQDKVVEVQLDLQGTRLYTRQAGRSFEAAMEKALDTLRSQVTRFKGRHADARRRNADSAR